MPSASASKRIGLISDTHGLLRPEAVAFLRGSDYIVHAGDIGAPEVLEALSAIAPLTVVRGNNDRDAWAAGIPDTAALTVEAVRICVIHDRADFKGTGFDVVVSGHSHKPRIEERDGVLYVNPGSAGPRRFSLPVAAGELRIAGRTVKPRLVELGDRAAGIIEA
jgi:putative phosphoesterase